MSVRKAQARFRHRHVIPVREVIEERDFVHLVSDFVKAPRLSDILTGRDGDTNRDRRRLAASIGERARRSTPAGSHPRSAVAEQHFC